MLKQSTVGVLWTDDSGTISRSEFTTILHAVNPELMESDVEAAENLFDVFDAIDVR